MLYPADDCPEHVQYDCDKTIVRECLDAIVTVFQDGYILCSIVDVMGCEECYRRFEERHEDD